eukprot:sb/3464330/
MATARVRDVQSVPDNIRVPLLQENCTTNLTTKLNTTNSGWLTLGRHPSRSEGLVNTEVCYDTGGATGANCKTAQRKINVVQLCFLILWGVGSTQGGSGKSNSFCLFCTVPFTIRWRYTGTNCNWLNKQGYIRNCGDYFVYWLPKQTQGLTTYNTDADACKEDSYAWIDDDTRLAWVKTISAVWDNGLKTNWYRFKNGKQLINEECTPAHYGGSFTFNISPGTYYPGWMEGGHPHDDEVVQRTVYFQTGTNCKATSTKIKVKNCGSFFIYKLVPTSTYYRYTIAQEPCDNEVNNFDQEDRSIYEKSTSYTNDNGISEGWYEFKSGQYCFTTSATASCGSPRAATVLMCEGGFYLYRVIPTASTNYGYCADEDVCETGSEEWGREEDHRLRYTSVYGYRSSTSRTDSTLGTQWYKINIGLKRMPEESPGYMSCGFTNPVFSRKQELLHYVLIMLCFPVLPFHVSLPKGSRLGHNLT